MLMWILFLFFVFIVLIPSIESLTLNRHEFESLESIEEGTCVIPPIRANLTKHFIHDFAPEGGFYLPFNSKLGFVLIAEAILGRKLINQDDSTICPLLDLKIEGEGKSCGTISGFGGNTNTATLSCEEMDWEVERHKCQIRHENGFGGGGNIYLSLTDQKTYFVVVVCTGADKTTKTTWNIRNNKKTFNVVSTKPKLDDEVIARISSHVQELGFHPKMFNTIDYSSC